MSSVLEHPRKRSPHDEYGIPVEIPAIRGPEPVACGIVDWDILKEAG